VGEVAGPIDVRPFVREVVELGFREERRFLLWAATSLVYRRLLQQVQGNGRALPAGKLLEEEQPR
jgi:hypothetical protein